jgi:hypothetical protein
VASLSAIAEDMGIAAVDEFYLFRFAYAPQKQSKPASVK